MYFLNEYATYKILQKKKIISQTLRTKRRLSSIPLNSSALRWEDLNLSCRGRRRRRRGEISSSLFISFVSASPSSPPLLPSPSAIPKLIFVLWVGWALLSFFFSLVGPGRRGHNRVIPPFPSPPLPPSSSLPLIGFHRYRTYTNACVCVYVGYHGKHGNCVIESVLPLIT